MREKKIRLRVSMPGKAVMDESVEMVILTAAEGKIGILPGHEPASITLRNGPLRIRNGEKDEIALTIMGGYATVRDSTVNVLTPVADTPERIGHAIEAIKKEREQNIKYEQAANLEINRAEIALKNILLRREEAMSAFPIGRTRNEADGENR